jgi:dTDP-4-amino-4,6-dideoxygalactose transaminase
MLSQKRVARSVAKAIYNFVPLRMKSLIAGIKGDYPRVLRNEIKAIKRVLGGTSWNSSYSIKGKHIELEKEFAEYIGSKYAISVSGGGVGLQMLIRALGLGPQEEVLIQADTCAAVPQAILNSQTVPIIVDADVDSFQFSQQDLASRISDKTKIILATHMWGNPENLKAIQRTVSNKEIFIVEDACLALGGKIEDKFMGSLSTAGIFSFGSTKPVQAGEGGMLVTNDEELARELKAMREWGDRQTEFGIRDVKTLSWNGRMPEVIAALALEQLKSYPARLEKIQERVNKFRNFVSEISDFTIVPTREQGDLSYTQLSLKLSPECRYTKKEFLQLCSDEQIHAFHANFEPLTELTLFQNGNWQKWIREIDSSRTFSPEEFPGSYEVYKKTGIGLTRRNFESNRNYVKLLKFVNRNFA